MKPLAAVPHWSPLKKSLATILTTHQDVSRYFCQNPRIAVLSLNPHAGEGGMFGDHEERIIIPAIREARAKEYQCQRTALG